MSDEASIQPSQAVQQQEEETIDLKEMVLSLKKTVDKLAETQSYNAQIKEEAQKQIHNVSTIESPLRQINNEYTAEQFYEDTINEDEQLFFTNGVRKKFCLREHGTDIPSQSEFLKFKILLKKELYEKMNEESCSKENIINSINQYFKNNG